MELFYREQYISKIRGFYHDTDIIKVITGVRRCGKSSLMEMIKDELIKEGVNEEHIIYIDLDSRKYRKIKADNEFEEVVDELSVSNGTKYLFVDEIQNIKNFEEIINAFRNDGDYSIFITGSNSYLLSGDLSTKLTGRYIEFELFTLNFNEYLSMKKFYNKTIDSNLHVELDKFLREGGFPRTVRFDTFEEKQVYAKAVIDEIFEKDIKRRVKIRNVEVFEAVRNFIINNFGATMSIQSLQHSLQKAGLSVQRATLKRYIDELVSAKILYQCNRFDMKSKKALSGEKKYYLADTSFYFAFNTDNRINYGPALENMVYLYARGKNYAVSVGRIGRLECDFILRDMEQNYSYIQVAYTINESKQTEDREYKPLEMIRDNYPKYVATTDYLLQKRNGIKHINILEFIKDGKKF
ncbi:MAG: ATP-binding protein [Catonella sp.]|uniref:ATP-binding protein n=1 Tax=Catonella sp. TaxID=2382125 RepID=UPI003FA12D4B